MILKLKKKWLSRSFIISLVMLLSNVFYLGAQNVPFNSNLLINHSSELGFSNWNVSNGGSGWRVDANRYWASSYQSCILEQTVDFVSLGFSTAQLDSGLSLLAHGQVHAPYEDSTKIGTLQMKVILYAANNSVLDTIVMCDTTYSKAIIPWTTYLQQVSLPIGTRKAKFYVAGKSARYWSGQYGPCFRLLWLSLSKQPLPITHQITTISDSTVTITADKSQALPNELVTFSYTFHDSSLELDGIMCRTPDNGYIIFENDSQFYMPAYDVNISKYDKASTPFQITTKAVNGSIGSIPSQAYEGDTIWLTSVPNSSYRLIRYLVNNTELTNNNYFIMPRGAVTLEAIFQKYININIIADNQYSPNGTLTVNRTVANEGDTITVSYFPNEGYVPYIPNLERSYGNSSDVTMLNRDQFIVTTGESILIRPIFSKVETVTISKPFFDGFEDNIENREVLNWNQLKVTGSDSWKANSESTTRNRTPYAGNYNATLYFNNERWLKRPFYLESGKNYQFSMYVRQDMANSSYANMLVMLGTNYDLLSQTIISETGITNGDYQLLSNNFTVDSSGIYWLGIKGFMNLTPYYISLDNIMITEIGNVNVTTISLGSGTCSVNINTVSTGDTITITNTPNANESLRKNLVINAIGDIIEVDSLNRFVAPVGGDINVLALFTGDINVANEEDLNNTRIILENDTLETTIQQTANISFTKEWTPMGNVNYPFKGIYNGNGFSLNNLQISTKREGTGLFGYVKPGTILNDIHIMSGRVESVNDYMGSIVGVIADVDSGSVIFNGCCNYADVISMKNSSITPFYIGGLLGYNANARATVEMLSCYNVGTVGNKNYLNYTQSNGGLSSYLQNNPTLNYCFNVGTIYGIKTYSSPIADYEGELNGDNNYYLSSLQSEVKRDDFDDIVLSEFTSGSFVWQLDTIYGQTIGVDSFPVYRNSSNKVYRISVVFETETVYFYSNELFEIPVTLYPRLWNYNGTIYHEGDIINVNSDITITLQIDPSNCYGPNYVNARADGDKIMVYWDRVQGYNQWEVAYSETVLSNPENGTTIIADTNMVMLENLLLDTRYYIYVRSRCNDTVYSDWTEVYIAETEKCVSPCLFTIEMFDSYGDGWNGNEISIVQNGNVIDVATFTDGSESEMSFTVCPDSIDFIFKTGRYLEEISFKIYDTNGALIYQCDDATRFYNGKLLFSMGSCLPQNCNTAENIETTTLSDSSINVTWDTQEEVTSWSVFLSDTLINPTQYNQIVGNIVNTNSVTLNNMIKGKVYFVYVGAFCEAYNNYIWDYTTVYTDTVSPSFTDITLDYNYQGNFVNDARVIIVDDIDFMATGYKLDLTDTTDIVIKALTGTLSNCIIHVSGDPLFSSFDTYYNTAEIESDSTIYILIEGSIKISDYVVNIRKKSLHNSFKEVTLDYFETGNILYNDAFINIEGEESFGSAYKFTLQQPEEVYIIFNSKDLENSSLVIYEDSTLQVPVTKTNGIYNLSDTTYYAAFSSNNQLGTYELAIRKYGEITYTDIQLNYNSVEVIDMHSDHININGNLLPAKAFRLTVTDTTYFITDILSSGVGSYDLMSFKDSLFREPIQTSNNLYYTDSVCYFLLIGDAYDSVEIAIMKAYSYHEFPYQERISINVPKTGTIDFSDSLACINNRVNLARSFTVGLVKDKVYKFKLTTMVSSDTRLFNCLSLLIPDTLQGSYNIINGDIITETYDGGNNTSLLKIELSYKANSTADYKLLMQTFASIIPIDYTILVTEFEEPISFDSLLRTAQVINYNVDLPYLEIGNFNETSQFVISDTVFRGSRDKEVFAAKAYAITLEAGDSVICDFGGAFDSYLGLYTRNAQGDCIRIIEEDDTYDTNNNSREQIRYHANSNAVYYFVITTYSELELGGWSLQILKSMADFDDFEIEYKVNLIASETEIYFNKAFTETDVKAELAKLKLYAINSTDTIGEVINNPGLWTVDLINNVATYICNEYYLPDGYYFENNIGRTDINLVQKTENIWAQTEQSIVLYPNPARDICYLDIEGIQTDYIYLFDIAGRLILTQKATGNRTEAINVSGIPAGIYQIKVGSKIVKLVVKP